MKHNGVVTRILKTSSATSAGNAGGGTKARPAAPATTPSGPATPAPDDDVDNLFAGMDDLTSEAEQTPVFAANMEREIAAILARGGVKTRTPTVGAPTPPAGVGPIPAPQIHVAQAADSPPVVQTAEEAEGERVTVRAPGHDPDSEPRGAILAPPRPPPLPSDMREAVTARPPPQEPPPLPVERPPSPQAAPKPPPPPLPVRRPVPAAAKPPEPVRVHVKPPPVPLPLGPRRPEPVVEVIDAPAETRREPGMRAPTGNLARRTTNARAKAPPPVEYWADTSLVESVPPSDPADSPIALLGDGSEYRQSYPRGFQGGGLVLYRHAREGEILPDRQALHGPPPLPPAAFTAARLTPVRDAFVAAERAPQAATAWVQQPTMTTTTAKRPLRARLQAAALGIAAGVAISMVLTWRPEKTASDAPALAVGGAPVNAVAMMAPPAKPPAQQAPSVSSAAPTAPAEAVAPKPESTARETTQAPSNKTQEKREAAPKGAATAKATPSKPAAPGTQKAPAQATEPAKAKTPTLSGRVTGDDE